ncbi:unnamed protein product [Caenorhabditis auriculariae]|uniref:PPM-type phosphatase domain-containing protein n=1 Tax=Caenorhabditis auriculariae TaxID=2777116 RepID=A0A8S1GSA9_9PELO|nr:unnamed protein product [Caenorhabditis auriculariae]
MLNRNLLKECRRGVRSARWNADAHLRAHERRAGVSEEAILRVDTCQLAANSPIEDFYSAAKCLSSSAFLFGVFDGHAGPECGRYVSTNLFPYICSSILKKHEVTELPPNRRLQWLFSSADTHLPNAFIESQDEKILKYHDKFRRNLDLYKGTVREALKFAFESCDEDLARSALPTNTGYIDQYAAKIAASGSCATIAHVRNRHLHVANIGDAAAVLGIVNPNGSVVARQLSRAHTTENADEVHRIRNQHPVSESQTILKNERLLGELSPLRAFGDVRFKWPLDLQQVVLKARPPPNLWTPPYLTASPEVFYHKLTENDRFLVLATDGLWEWLDPDTVVRLVHDHTLGTMTLQPYSPPNGATLHEVQAALRERAQGESQAKKPIDENCATHVIRHALGGISGGATKQYQRLIDILQVPPGRARCYRDDISVMVIHFNDRFLNEFDDDVDA